MSRSSSIFSFDTLVAIPRPTRSFVLTLVLCAAFRIVLGVYADELSWIPAYAMNKQYEYTERVIARESTIAPRVLLMGDSQMRYGLIEDRMAEQLGLRPGEVVNLGIESGTAWDAMVFIRRNPKLLKNVQLVVFNVNPMQFNPGQVELRFDYFYRFSSLSEKWGADRLDQRARLLFDYLWPHHSERRALVTWLMALRGETDRNDDAGYRPAWLEHNMAKMRARMDEYIEGRQLNPRFLGISAETSPQQEEFFRRFVAFWTKREGGTELLLVSMPVRSNYYAAIERDPQVARGYRNFLDLVHSQVGEHVMFLDLHDPARLAIDETREVLDYIHLFPEGAAKLTDAVSRRIRQYGWLKITAPTYASTE